MNDDLGKKRCQGSVRDPSGLELTIFSPDAASLKELTGYLKELYPDGNLQFKLDNLGAFTDVSVGKNAKAPGMSVHPKVAVIISRLIRSKNKWTINVDDAPRTVPDDLIKGSKGPLHSQLNETARKFADLLPQPTRGEGTGGQIYVPTEATSKYVYGFYDKKGQPKQAKFVIIFAHELGHAYYLDLGEEVWDSIGNPRPGHDLAIKLENEIQKELFPNTPANDYRGLWGDPNNGESLRKEKNSPDWRKAQNWN